METRIDMHLKKNKTKGIAIGGIPIRKASELFGNLNVVFFSPEDLNIIKNGPSERRRFIDMELCQLDKVYTSCLVSYNKVLVQRNRLLKELPFHPEYEDTLPVMGSAACEIRAFPDGKKRTISDGSQRDHFRNS